MKNVRFSPQSFFLLVRILALSFFVLLITRLAAREKTRDDRLGTVYLKSGEQVEGLVQPNLDHNYLLVQIPNGTRAYNAWQVAAYTLHDHFSGEHQLFYSLPYLVRGKRADWFFELVQEGTLTLLKRDEEQVQEIPAARPFPATGYMPPPVWQTVTIADFYVLDPSAQIVRFYGGRKELLKLMPDQADRIDRFISVHKLNLADEDHLRAIFRYYDALQEGEEEENSLQAGAYRLE